jgi:hypothetical protein
MRVHPITAEDQVGGDTLELSWAGSSALGLGLSDLFNPAVGLW